MKKIKLFLRAVILITILSGCNDGFLERYPLDELTNKTFWTSENDLSSYTATLYTQIPDHKDVLWDDNVSDNMAPATYDEKSAGLHLAETGTWDWSYLRKCNFFLDNYGKAKIEDAIKNEYAAEVRFFRAWFYFDFVVKYGDLPWVDRTLSTDDTEILYGNRAPRNEVMDHVIDDLTYATEHLSESRQEGRINKYAALHLKARICLFEGTYRKYHKLGNPVPYLQQAAEAAEQLMNSGKFALYSTGNPTMDYRNLWTLNNLIGNPEMILSKHYDSVLLGHGGDFPIRYIPIDNNGLTKDMVNDYLCTDGMPIALSVLYKGDSTLENEFANRDPRMAQTIVSPGIGFWGEGDKNEVVPRLHVAQGAGSSTSTGYHWMKAYSAEAETMADKAETDLPIFRYAETLLIYAEAKTELDQINQSDIDKSINLIRKRVNMPDMVIANLRRDPDSDMTQTAGYLDQEVSVLLEEIRRERRVELAVEGFRRNDLLRWGAGKFYEKPVLGARWSYFLGLKDVKGLPIYDESSLGKDIWVNKDGYIEPYQRSLPKGRAFDPKKHYLEAIPLVELSLNPKLGQNPGW